MVKELALKIKQLNSKADISLLPEILLMVLTNNLHLLLDISVPSSQDQFLKTSRKMIWITQSLSPTKTQTRR